MIRKVISVFLLVYTSLDHVLVNNAEAQVKPKAFKTKEIFAPYTGNNSNLRKLACGLKNGKWIFLIKDGKSYLKYSEWYNYQKALSRSSNKSTQSKAKKTLNKYPKALTKPVENDCKDGPNTVSPTPETPTPNPTTPPGEGDLSLLAPITRPLTDDDVRHLYQRAALGAVPNEAYEIARVQGVEALVNFMMSYRAAPEVEANAARYLDDLVDGSRPANEADVREAGLQYWSLYILLNSPNRYHERLAFFFLHNLLATSQDALSYWQKELMVGHINLLRAASIDGNYIPLLKKISRDPAMLVWLDGALNTKDSPNVNYSRELFELFSLGSPNPLYPNEQDYTEADVQSSGRMHTGWGVIPLEVEPDFYRYSRILTSFDVDKSPQTLFEGTSCQRTINHNFDSGLPRDMEVIDQTFACRRPENFLAWRLAREYLNEEPNRDVTLALSNLLRIKNFNFNETLKVLFMSNVFYEAQNKRSIVMSPVEQVIQAALRAGMVFSQLTPQEGIGTSTDLISSLYWWIRDAGLRLTRFPTVFGTDPLEYANSAWQLQLHNTLVNLANTNRFRPVTGNETARVVLWTWSNLMPSGIDRPNSTQVVESLLPKFNLTHLNTSQINELKRVLDHSVSYNGTTRTITSVNYDPFNSLDYWDVNNRVARLWLMLASLNYLR